MGGKLLVVDDDQASCRLMKAIFAPEGFDVVAAHDGPTALELVAADPPEIVFLDLRLPGLTGLEVMERLRASHPDLPVIMLTAYADVKSAVRATQLGAADYLTKPIDHEEIVLVARRALETRALRVEVEDLRRRVGEGGILATQMGSSPQARAVLDQVRIVAASNFTALILGETGTGKELVAQAIHRQSERRSKPFVALDCGAIPEALLESELFGHEAGSFTGAQRKKEGQFQLADGGTFFLDEIGNLPLSLQQKLLRVLESRRVQAVGATNARFLDVRFVAATNFDLQARVHEGAFRADLYFRLAEFTVSLPPLRERPLDIPHLVQRFADEASVELRKPVQTIVPEAMDLLLRHPWPGNVRELRNVIRQAVLKTEDLVIRREALLPVLGARAAIAAPPFAASSGDIGDRSLKEIAADAAAKAERQAISETLRAVGGNKSQAARTLRTDYKTLHLKMKLLGIRARDFER